MINYDDCVSSRGENFNISQVISTTNQTSGRRNNLTARHYTTQHTRAETLVNRAKATSTHCDVEGVAVWDLVVDDGL